MISGLSARVFLAVIAGSCLTVGGASMANETFSAGLLHSGLPGEDPALVNALKKALEEAGYEVETIGLDLFCDPLQLTAARFDLLVIPHAPNLPPPSMKSVENYLAQGGNIIALKTPLWERPLIYLKGEWVTAEEFQLKNAGVPPEHVVFDFTPDDIANWERSTNHPEHAFVLETVPEGPAPNQRALHVVISELDGWDTHGHVDIQDPFPEGHTLTVFSTKGGPRTAQIVVEWREEDESRWIATVSLAKEWKQFVLSPKAFRYWPSNPKRGFRGDIFQPKNAKRMNVGVAFSHTGAIGGRHEFWVGPFGTAATPEYQEILDARVPPALEILSPGYKFFECSDVAILETRKDQTFIGYRRVPAPGRVRSSYPRPGAAGFNKRRDWRWAPLIEARTKSNQWRGNPGVLLVHADGPYKGGVWASFSIPESDWYLTKHFQEVFGDLARRMKNGVFLIDGGTNFYTYYDYQDIVPGLRVVNTGPAAVTGLIGRVTITERGRKRRPRPRTWTWPLELPPGEIRSVSDSWEKKDRWPKDGYLVKAEILENSTVIDSAEHEVFMWDPDIWARGWVRIENGDFALHGKRWRPHGVNYMPSSGLAIEDNEFFEYWLSAQSYDPEVIERDLGHIADIGFNSVSIFIQHRIRNDQNLLDLLRRLDNHGLKANLSLRPGTPMDFQRDKMWDLIRDLFLSFNDTVFAYDLAWEPMWGKHHDRKRWDGDWEAWVIERYGSIENAEKDWEYPIPRDENGRITNPSKEQTEKDGEWRRMVAAYRRFLDCLLYEKYNAARRMVKSLDSHHHVSFRMSNAGDPTFSWDGRVTYDFPYLAGAVDILEPEAYGRIGDWEKVKPGWFEFEYARWAAPHLPMMWAEMGVSAWDRSAMKSTEELLAFQAQYYQDFYRMLISSGADGIFFWWYPGGYRWNEVSDFGIINPDGSDRPVTKAIRENGPEFINGPDARPIDYWIEIDRDAYANGIVGVYDAVKDEFWNAIDEGRVPGFRTLGTGTNSANCPPTAVGNVPWNGSNPAKFLDAAFDEVWSGVKGRLYPDPDTFIQIEDASVVREELDVYVPPIENGETVEIDPEQPVKGQITLTNLGEAVWLTPEQAVEYGGKGGVYLVVQCGDTVNRVPLPEPVDHLGSIEMSSVQLAPAGLKEPARVTLSLVADGRTPFGEKFTFTVEP